MTERLALVLCLALAGCQAPSAPSTPRSDPAPALPDELASALETLGRTLERADPERAREVLEDALARLQGDAVPGGVLSNDALRSDALLNEDEMAARRRQVIVALEAGADEEARVRLRTLLRDKHLAEAARQLESGDRRDALAAFDRALELEPDDYQTLLARGETALAIGLERGDRDFLEEALVNLSKAAWSDEPRALFAASRTARQLQRNTQALDYARRGMRKLESRPDAARELEVMPERVWAEASFNTYIEKRETPEAEQLFAETEDALERVVGKTPEDPWPWTQLANLYRWAGQLEDAQRALLAGVELAPTNTDLHEGLSFVSRQLGEREGGIEGGRRALLATYETFQTSHPDVALGIWYPAFERFNAALDSLLAGADESQEFITLGTEFRRCRELEPEFAGECLKYELMSKNGLGWCRFNAEDLDGAREAFQAMDDLALRGMEWEYPGKLLSGARGLEFVAARYAEKTDDASSLAKAAAIFDYLHVYQADNVTFANNAGFFNRDTGVILEQQARLLEQRIQSGSSSLSEAQREAMRTEADRLFARARELMERSYQAYVEASKLAPQEVRIINDTGLILTYYLQRDVEAAESYLRRAVGLGSRQVENTELDEDARFELLNAWGDAHQNLGYLYLTQKNDAAKAREWFEKSVEIGPDPRPLVNQRFLPDCDRALRGELNLETYRWGRERRR